jgi:hypothetical protein
MDILKMLAELREERESIEQAIMVIERLASGWGFRRRRTLIPEGTRTAFRAEGEQ